VLWLIDLDALSNAATVLQAMNDKSFAIALSVDTGSISRIDSSTLSGNATVTSELDDGNDPRTNVPEPSTLLLLGAGFAGVGLLMRKG
jgi:hypothetical protein